MSRVRRDYPRCRSAMWICMCGHTPEVVIYSKFHRNPFRGLGAPGVEICPFTLLWLLAFTTTCTTVQAVMWIRIEFARRVESIGPWRSLRVCWRNGGLLTDRIFGDLQRLCGTGLVGCILCCHDSAGVVRGLRWVTSVFSVLLPTTLLHPDRLNSNVSVNGVTAYSYGPNRWVKC